MFKREQARLFSFLMNIVCRQIWYQSKSDYMDWALVFSFSSIDLAFWCLSVLFFHVVCEMPNFNMVNCKAYGASFLYWVDFTVQIYILWGMTRSDPTMAWPWRQTKKNSRGFHHKEDPSWHYVMLKNRSSWTLRTLTPCHATQLGWVANNPPKIGLKNSWNWLRGRP